MKTNKSRNTDGLPPVYLMAGAVTAILVCALLSIGLWAEDLGLKTGAQIETAEVPGRPDGRSRMLRHAAGQHPGCCLRHSVGDGNRPVEVRADALSYPKKRLKSR